MSNSQLGRIVRNSAVGSRAHISFEISRTDALRDCECCAKNGTVSSNNSEEMVVETFGQFLE